MPGVKKFFGTDGIRGKVGEMPMQPEFLVKLGWAIGKVLAGNLQGRVLIGKDTRISGYLIESAIESGLAAAGADIYLLGPMPTPAIAYLTQTMQFDAGIVISASHNPYYDNGIKLFSSKGFKLPDEIELAIENNLTLPMTTVESARLGKAYRLEDAINRYVNFCKGILPSGQFLRGIKVVIDCANGANYYIAPRVFMELGATITVIHNQPNGLNINEKCGSTYPQSLQQTVLETQADLGIAFDGDGDRVIMVDNKGEVVDGDELLLILALAQHRKGTLQGGVVGTQMTNLGCELALAEKHVPFIRTKVGDRYVLEQLQAKHWQLGGESSGHLIHLGHTTTGDALVSALLVLQAIVENQVSLHTLKQSMQKFPQCLINVAMPTPIKAKQQQHIDDLVYEITQQLGKKGRVLLRPSGTEPLMRVMVEGENQAQVHALAQQLADSVETILQQ